MIKCPVCGEHEFKGRNNWEVCPVCGWTNDQSQIDYPDSTAENALSLNEAREWWAKKRSE